MERKGVFKNSSTVRNMPRKPTSFIEQMFAKTSKTIVSVAQWEQSWLGSLKYPFLTGINAWELGADFSIWQNGRSSRPSWICICKITLAGAVALHNFVAQLIASPRFFVTCAYVGVRNLFPDSHDRLLQLASSPTVPGTRTSIPLLDLGNMN